MKTWYIIPARKSSKGFKFKNRILFDYTAGTIPTHLANNVIVSSDDQELINRATELDFLVDVRESALADDHASMKDVLLSIIKKNHIKDDDEIILLYLTYPQRTWSDITTIYTFFQEQRASSLACAESITDHPHLCLYELDNNKGKQVVDHDLYRRQDYPKCFRYSLFVAVYKTSEVKRLNDLLFCTNTIFYKLAHKSIDVDHKQDLLQIEGLPDGC